MHIDTLDIIGLVVGGLMWLGGHLAMIKLMRTDLDGLGAKMSRIEMTVTRIEGFIEGLKNGSK